MRRIVFFPPGRCPGGTASIKRMPRNWLLSGADAQPVIELASGGRSDRWALDDAAAAGRTAKWPLLTDDVV